MWNLPKGDDFLPRISFVKLQTAYSEENIARSKIRLLCAIHRKKGEPIDDICQVSNLKKTTVHDILHRFVERGLDGKDDEERSGRPPKLNVKQRKKLMSVLDKGPKYNRNGLWTTKEVREIIRKEFGVKYAHPYVWQVLKAANFSIQRPRPKHYKSASDEEKAHFKKRPRCWQRNTVKEVSSWHASMRQHMG